MIRLAVRLAVSGGRESAVRLVLTALGVALGTTLLLLCAAADPAIRAHQSRSAWQYTGFDRADLSGEGDPLLWHLTDDFVDGREMIVLRVAAAGPGAPVPLGLADVPQPGEVAASPALARLIDELPADRLAERFPAAPTATVPDSYLAGPDDLVAVVGATPESLEGQPFTEEVHHIRTRPEPYQFTDFLRLVLAVGAVGLVVPVVVFVSTSTRLGAARREQRFAAMRLAGATPRQTAVVASVEAGASAAVGALLGVTGYLAARPHAAAIEIDGHESFTSDVRVAPLLLAVLVAGVPVVSVVAAMASLRRLRISPLGVARRSERARPTVRRLVPLVAGSAGFVVSLVAARGQTTGPGLLIPVMATFALMIYGIVVAGPWLTVLTARAIGGVGRSASSLLAGRRLEDDPGAGFRAVSGLVLAVFVVSVFSGMTPAIQEDDANDPRGPGPAGTLLAMLPVGTSIGDATAALGAVEGSGAGDAAILYAGPGAPDPREGGTRVQANEGPATLAACTDVVGLERGLDEATCPPGAVAEFRPLDSQVAAGWTLADLAELPAESLMVMTDGTPAVADRARTAIAHAVPGTVAWLESERAAESARQLTQLTRLANLALAFSLVVAGCGLAVAVAAGIIERRRPFALLRLSGMHLDELRRVALLEAAAPLLLIALASAALGLATAAAITGVAGGIPWYPPSVGYWVALAGGLALALAVSAAALPLLARTTAPSATRFE